MKTWNLLFLFSSLLCAAPGDSEVTLWKDDASAAVVLMFDDNLDSQRTHVLPALQ